MLLGLRDNLELEGYEVQTASDGEQGLVRAAAFNPDLVILDVLMPVMDGWTACSRIREVSEVPIIMLTSLDREDEMIKGLNLGAAIEAARRFREDRAMEPATGIEGDIAGETL